MKLAPVTCPLLWSLFSLFTAEINVQVFISLMSYKTTFIWIWAPYKLNLADFIGTLPGFHGSLVNVKFLCFGQVSFQMQAICNLYLMYGMIVRFTCLSGRCHLSLTSFYFFIGQFKFLKFCSLSINTVSTRSNIFGVLHAFDVCMSVYKSMKRIYHSTI